MNMLDILSRITALESDTNVQERGMSMNVDEWETDPAAHDQELVDSWHDTVVDALNQYEIDGPLSDKELEELCRAVVNDIGEVDYNTVHKIIAGELDQRERDREADGPQDSSDDAAALASAGHGSDEDYGTIDEASIADIPKDVLQRGIDQIEAGGEITKVFGQLNLDTKRQYMDQFRSLIRGAQNDAHMEYDTQGGDITPFLLDTMKGLVARGESAGAQGDVGGAHGDETISPIHGGQKEEPTMENLNLESLRYLSGINKTIAECGMGGPSTPASINITAGSGSELTGMLKDIMNLAGVHQVTPDHMPINKGPSAIVNAPPMAAEPQMKDLIAMVDEPEDGPHADSMNDADDEQEDEGMLMKGLGGMGGGAAGELAGGAIGTAVGGPIGGAIGSVAGDIAGTALGSELGDDDKEKETDEGSGEKEKNRPWDSSPHEKIRQDGVRKFGDIDNNHQNALVGKNVKQNESIDSIVKSLYQDYQSYIAEQNAK